MRADAPVFVPRWNRSTADEPIARGNVEPERHGVGVFSTDCRPAQDPPNRFHKRGKCRRHSTNNKRQNGRGIQKNNNALGDDKSQELLVNESRRGKNRRNFRNKTKRCHIVKTHGNNQHVAIKNAKRPSLKSKSKHEGKKRNNGQNNKLISLSQEVPEKIFDSGEESFPLLSAAEQYNSKEYVPMDSKGKWSIVAKDGHVKSEIRNFEKIQEYERHKREIETYTRMDILTTDKLATELDDTRKDATRYSVALEGEEDSAREKHETAQVKFVNLNRLREKWSQKFEEWKQQVAIEQEMTKLENQEKHEVPYGKESCYESEEPISDNDTGVHDKSDSIGEYNHAFDTVKSDSLDSSIACEKYLKTTYPLHFALLEEDEMAIETMMRLSPEITHRDARVPPEVFHDRISVQPSRLCTRLSVLHLAIIYGKAHLLRIILSSARASALDLVSSTFALDDVDDEKRTPLMLACALGLDDCIPVLLSFGPKVTAKHVQTGDNALHFACRFGMASTVKALLGSVQGNDRLHAPKGKLCWRQRLLCARNRLNETPLHVACERGSVDLVQAILYSCSTSVSEKALAIENNIGQTPLICAIKNGAPELVSFLLTWRGNQRGNGGSTKIKYCPLVAAAETKSIEMLDLILEHHHLSTFEAFDYSYALFTVVSMFQDSESEAFDAIRMLIDEGADPYQSIASIATNGTCVGSEACNSITYAALQGYAGFVSCMIDSYNLQQRKKMKLMREDPYLRTKPNEYFQSIDNNEHNHIMQALEDTLVKIIICSFENPETSTRRLGCCLSLFDRGGYITNRGLIPLLMGLRSSDSFDLINSIDSIVPDHLEFEAYFQCEVSSSMNSPYTRPDAQYFSRLLLQMDCFISSMPINTNCYWINEHVESMRSEKSLTRGNEKWLDGTCYLNANGFKVPVNQEILMRKSGKIDAAIRFEEMKQSTSESKHEGTTIEVCLDISVHHLCFLVQHCYHGSIFYGLSADSKVCCEELLDLYHLAIEYLCPSLAMECEMRLLSDNPYQCFCCSCGASKDIYNHRQGEKSRSFRVKVSLNG